MQALILYVARFGYPLDERKKKNFIGRGHENGWPPIYRNEGFVNTKGLCLLSGAAHVLLLIPWTSQRRMELAFIYEEEALGRTHFIRISFYVAKSQSQKLYK